MPTHHHSTNPYAQTRPAAAPAISRTTRAFAWVLLLHAGVFFVLHSVTQLDVPAKLSEAIAAHIVHEFRVPDSAQALPPPLATPNTPTPSPLQPAPTLPSQATTPLAQAPSAAPAITAAAALPAPIATAVPVQADTVKSAVVIPPSRVASSCAVPRYPAISERLREEGVVLLRFLISENGQVLSGRVEKSSGYKRLDDAALAALSLCQFKPATLDGKARQDWSALLYRWELKD